jgi:cyclohexanecarboxylate-CoA ligase
MSGVGWRPSSRLACAAGELTERAFGLGPELFVGYLHPEDNDPSFDAEGFFRSGDLGRWVHGNWPTRRGSRG